jgi:hypothetical protein
MAASSTGGGGALWSALASVVAGTFGSTVSGGWRTATFSGFTAVLTVAREGPGFVLGFGSGLDFETARAFAGCRAVIGSRVTRACRGSGGGC